MPPEENTEEVVDRGDTLVAAAPEVTDPIVDPLKDAVVEDDDTETEEEDKEAKDPKDGAKDEKKKDTRIPLARHKEILEKGRLEREALYAKLAKYEQGSKVAETNDEIEKIEAKLVAMEADYNKLLADGEIEKASAKMTEIRRLSGTAAEQKTALAVQAATIEARESVRFDTTVERLEAAYPVLDPQHEDFDKDIVAEVLDVQRAFIVSGATPSAAMQRAVGYVLGAATAKEKHATEVTPAVAKEDVAAKRKEEALKRNIAAAKATPASTAKVGLNSDDKGGILTAETAMKMNQDDFNKLGEKDLARLRGDDL